MAMNCDFNKSDQDKNLSSESRGRNGEVIRDYMIKDGAKWRWGRPNYARVNEMYFTNRTKQPVAGSPEELVTKVVKNWEVDSHHLADAKDWVTIDNSKFMISVNCGKKFSAQEFADIGPYNMLLQDMSKGYDMKLNPGAEGANSFWSNVFTQGFAWECLEVYSGPPKVSFKWRHFGKYSGTYQDAEGNRYKGDGQIFNLYGHCVATVNANAIIEDIEVFYNPDDMIKNLMKPELMSEPAKKPAAAASSSWACCAKPATAPSSQG
jgi:hypothetical protein